MFAIVRSGAHQFKVEKGSLIKVEKIEGNVGDTIHFEEVLLVGGNDSTKIGQPTVSGARVAGEIVAQVKGPKLEIFKKWRRKGKQVHKGHRQKFTTVRISEIA